MRKSRFTEEQIIAILKQAEEGEQAVPFQGGTLCVKVPLKRTHLQSSGGNPPPNDCSGNYSLDFNAYIATGVDPALIAGARIDGQYWAREPGFAPPDNTSLTDAIHATICPGYERDRSSAVADLVRRVSCEAGSSRERANLVCCLLGVERATTASFGALRDGRAVMTDVRFAR